MCVSLCECVCVCVCVVHNMCGELLMKPLGPKGEWSVCVSLCECVCVCVVHNMCGGVYVLFCLQCGQTTAYYFC